MSTIIDSKDALRRVYKAPNGAQSPRKSGSSTGTACVSSSCRRSVVLATSGAGGGDVSPRGGPPGFVKALGFRDAGHPGFPGQQPARFAGEHHRQRSGRTALLRARHGRNTAGERPCGDRCRTRAPRARGSRRADADRSCPRQRRAGVPSLRQGADALGLWDPSIQIERSTLPSIGEMIKDQINQQTPAETQAEMLQLYRETLY